jgi:hypothetical protein
MARAWVAAAADFPALMEELDIAFPKDANFEARDAAEKWILGLWIRQDADAAAAWVAGKKDDFLGSVFGFALGRAGPDKAEAILNGPFGKSFGKYFAASFKYVLSATDPRRYLLLFPATSTKYSAPSEWVRALGNFAVTAPEEAASRWVEAKPPAADKALTAILSAWVQHDAQAARNWVDALENPEMRRGAQHAWLGALARENPAAARSALAEMDPGAWLPDRTTPAL